MSASRRDYVAIAKILANSYTAVAVREQVRTEIARAIADHFHEVSPINRNGNRSFDRYRFLTAAGVR